MVVIFYTVIFTGITLIVYFLLDQVLNRPAPLRRRRKKSQPKISEDKDERQEIFRLKERINSLVEELQKASYDYSSLKRELQKAKESEEEAKERLLQYGRWVESSQKKMESLEKQKQELERKLLEKEKGLEKDFSQSIKLQRQAREAVQRASSLEEEKKKMIKEIAFLKKEIKEKEEKIDEYLNIINEFKRKEEESSFVSKDEYNQIRESYEELKTQYEALSSELESKDKELELKQIELKKAIERIVDLEGIEIKSGKEREGIEEGAGAPSTEVKEKGSSVESQRSQPAQIKEQEEESLVKPLEEVLPESEQPPSLEVEEKAEVISKVQKPEVIRKVELERLRNIGIMAHIDAGKTTLTERILFYTGRSHKIGEVHDGQAQMDWMEQEKERGITITSATTTCEWNNSKINIIDTPGHIDFTVEVERSLRVLDGAIIMFSAVEGVEAQSENVWHQCDKYNISRIIFVNKMDRRGADFFAVLKDIEDKLGKNILPLQIPLGGEENFQGIIDLLEMKAYIYDEESLGRRFNIEEVPQDYKRVAQEYRHKMIEKIVNFDESLMSKYLKSEESITNEELIEAIRKATISSEIFPVLCGSALKNKGVQKLLDAVTLYLPSPLDLPPIEGYNPKDSQIKIKRYLSDIEPFTALAFKVQSDTHMGKLVYFRVYAGSLKAGSYVLNATKGKKERVGKLLQMHANHKKNIDEVLCGDIAAGVGLSHTVTGDTLCDINNPIILESMEFPTPVVSLSIKPQSRIDQDRLAKALARLLEEDPTFLVQIDEETKETILTGMGELHLEVIVDRLRREFNVKAAVGKPKVAYKETIQTSIRAEGKYIRQTGGRGQYGHVVIELSPTPRGEGFRFIDKIVGGRIPKNFIPSVERGLREAMKRGPYANYPVVDVEVTLVDGSYHEVDSSDIAFQLAAKRGFKEAFMKCKPLLLEPYMTVEVIVPEEYTSNIVGSICSRRGKIISMENKGKLKFIVAEAPLAEMFGYASLFRSLSSGRANSMMYFKKYSEVPSEIAEKIVAERRQQDKEEE